MDRAIEIFGILGAIITISLGLPQLIKQAKSKETGKISFTSFWVFYIGIVLWTAYGLFSGFGYWQVFSANFICGLIYTGTMILLYKYKKDISKRAFVAGMVGIAIVLLIFLSLLVLFVFSAIGYFTNRKYIPTLTEGQIGILAAIAPSLTTFAFLPQLVICIKQKSFHGITIWMAIVYLMNNGVWVTYFILKGVHSSAWREVIPAIVWQIVSITIYGLQFGLTLKYNRLAKNNAESKQILQSL